MAFRLEIETDNDAFQLAPEMEVSRLMRVAAEHVNDGRTEGKCIDLNGNTCGSYGFTA
jgi:hypothetical protein